jgi:hypothetical protein
MVVCKVRYEKNDPDWTRITIGGNKICYPGTVGTNTALLKLIKLILNSVKPEKVPASAPWLGIPIFGSNSWDPHWKQNSDSVFDSEDSVRIFLKI